jgi:hypothetical protein
MVDKHGMMFQSSTFRKYLGKIEHLVQKGVAVTKCSLSSTLQCGSCRKCRAALDAQNDCRNEFLGSFEHSPDKWSNEAFDVSHMQNRNLLLMEFQFHNSTRLPRKASIRTPPGALWERTDDLNEAFEEGAPAIGRAFMEVDEADTAPELDLKFLLLSGKLLFSLKAKQSWTGAHLFAAALDQMQEVQPAMFPLSLVCNEGVIHDENQTLETFNLTAGDSICVVMSCLVGRYCGTARAACSVTDIDDVFEVKYILDIAPNFRFDLSITLGGSYVATLHGKLALGGRFIFYPFCISKPSARVWLDDTGVLRLSDTGKWDSYYWDSAIVKYDGVERLLLEPLSTMRPNQHCR